MTRVHPFDFVFGELAQDLFPEIGGGQTPPSLLTFAQDPAALETLARIGGPDPSDPSAEAAVEYLSLLYASYRFWHAGRPTITVSRESLQHAMDAPPSTGPATFPNAVYLSFPSPWFWARLSESTPHEPLDGCFIVDNPGEGNLLVVAVFGIRETRSGFSQIAVTAEPGDFLIARDMVRAEPFAPDMEGGSAAGFRSIASQAELLHLVHLALRSAGL